MVRKMAVIWVLEGYFRNHRYIMNQVLRRGSIRQFQRSYNASKLNHEFSSTSTVPVLFAFYPTVGSDMPATEHTGLLVKISLQIEDWTLAPRIEAAKDQSLIKQDTYTQALLAKDFRNLIHPGRSIRLGQKCDKGTAFSTLAALEFIIRDLTP